MIFELKRILLIILVLVTVHLAQGQDAAGNRPPRERLLMDQNWRFAFGNAIDATKDFNFRNSWNLAKASLDYSDLQVAGVGFNDLAWRELNLPHDWVLELPHGDLPAPFRKTGSESSLYNQNGFRLTGLQYPATSIGWYRKSFEIPASDLGKRLWVEFDGVRRDSWVFLNGCTLGRHMSGYTSFRYDITDYVNYGGKNTLTVRCDATEFEGWWYEGAGIYRHTWLVKTSPLHVAPWGTHVISDVKADAADLTAKTRLANDSNEAVRVDLVSTVLDSHGQSVAQSTEKDIALEPWRERELAPRMTVPNPMLWSLVEPNLYRLVTEIKKGTAVVDRYETTFGIRTIRFDANLGFLLNGKSVKIKGASNHQDAGCVGVAVPDAVYDYRVKALKAIGCNAWRCAHNPPAPELLESCDRLGMLVMDETRMCGSHPEALEQMRSIVLRDRNHPSVILWSIGNEESPLQGNITGERVAATVQRHIKEWDPSRPVTSADNGFDPKHGFPMITDVAGCNYPETKDMDEWHRMNPTRPITGTEGGWKQSSRGAYQNDSRGRIEAYNGLNLYRWWKNMANRPFMGGGFVWTGFDYRGETHRHPPVNNSSGLLDLCGFPKDHAYYLKSCWVKEPVLHIMPHWNWAGKEGKEIDVRVLSNCEEVELSLNGTSLGRKKMVTDEHLAWKVKYAPGTLSARGYRNSLEIVTCKVETTGAPAAIRLIADKPSIKANGEDLAIVRIEVVDENGRNVPTADNPMEFSLNGLGHLLGVSNGDPDDREPERFVTMPINKPLEDWRSKKIKESAQYAEVATDLQDSDWKKISIGSGGAGEAIITTPNTMAIYRTNFDLTEEEAAAPEVKLVVGYMDDEMKVYLNGKLIIESGMIGSPKMFDIKPALRAGRNVMAVVHKNTAGGGGFGRGISVFIPRPQPKWSHRVFNGLGQIMLQAAREPGEMEMTVRSPGLQSAVLKINSELSEARSSLP